MVSERQIADWYDQQHKSRLVNGKGWTRLFEEQDVFLDYLKVKSGKKLFDIGCGVAYLLKEAHQRGLETFGIDISSEAVKIAHYNSPYSNITVGKGEQLEFPDEYFDYVTSV